MIHHLGTTSAYELAGELHGRIYDYLINSTNRYPKILGVIEQDPFEVIYDPLLDPSSTGKLRASGTFLGYKGYQTLSHSKKTGAHYFTSTYWAPSVPLDSPIPIGTIEIFAGDENDINPAVVSALETSIFYEACNGLAA